jgi:hypothetical protein
MKKTHFVGNRVIFHLKNFTEIELLNPLNIVQLALDLSDAADTTDEAATSSFGGQAVSCPILKAGRLSAAAEVPTQEVYRELNLLLLVGRLSAAGRVPTQEVYRDLTPPLHLHFPRFFLLSFWSVMCREHQYQKWENRSLESYQYSKEN